ncbi:MAG TPA: peptidylprolyl isomerase [Bdellovibrionota bacterium]|nr:peptidylprolyl isomerase [Bdellovibrionota bacterium]
MKKILRLFVLGFAVIGAAHAATQAGRELAKVNNTSISLEAFEKKYNDNKKFFQLRAPSKRAVLEDLIKIELGVQKAKELKLDQDPEVQDRMKMVLYHALLDRQLGKQFESIHITDGEAKSYYDKNPEIRTSHIFVAVRRDAKPEDAKKARDKIDEIRTKYLAPGKMSFAEVAQRYSEGAAAAMGGDVDFQTRDKLDPAYYDAAVKLRKGQTTGVVRTEFGFHIIKLTDVRPWDDVDKAQIKRLVFDERRGQIFEKFMSQLRAQAQVTVRPELLGAE